LPVKYSDIERNETGLLELEAGWSAVRAAMLEWWHAVGFPHWHVHYSGEAASYVALGCVIE
jgi:hypothetical protein